jgi:hypothetical protein
VFASRRGRWFPWRRDPNLVASIAIAASNPARAATDCLLPNGLTFPPGTQTSVRDDKLSPDERIHRQPTRRALWRVRQRIEAGRPIDHQPPSRVIKLGRSTLPALRRTGRSRAGLPVGGGRSGHSFDPNRGARRT